ncbi:MAG: SIMPL domain-containing protein, partial [Brevundimonas sp.]
IDPSGRACQTDVLAGWPSYGATPLPATVDEVVVTGARAGSAAPPPPAPPAPPRPDSEADQIEAARLALQPPLRWLSSQACVVYGLN